MITQSLRSMLAWFGAQNNGLSRLKYMYTKQGLMIDFIFLNYDILNFLLDNKWKRMLTLYTVMQVTHCSHTTLTYSVR